MIETSAAFRPSRKLCTADETRIVGANGIGPFGGERHRAPIRFDAEPRLQGAHQALKLLVGGEGGCARRKVRLFDEVGLLHQRDQVLATLDRLGHPLRRIEIVVADQRATLLPKRRDHCALLHGDHRLRGIGRRGALGGPKAGRRDERKEERGQFRAAARRA